MCTPCCSPWDPRHTGTQHYSTKWSGGRTFCILVVLLLHYIMLVNMFTCLLDVQFSIDQLGPLVEHQFPVCTPHAHAASGLVTHFQAVGNMASPCRLYARLNRWAGIILFISLGTSFQRLEVRTLKKFLLRSSLPFFTYTFKLSAATLVTLSLSLAFSNHVL